MFDRVLSFARVVASSLGAKRGSVLYDLAGIGEVDDPADAGTEVRDGQEVYSALGVVGRAPKGTDQDPDLFLEALAARTSDGLVPFAFRDPRILKWLNRGASAPTMPKEGQIIYAGYGGGFLSFETEPVSGGPINKAILYVPYARNGSGVPTKAHIITVGRDGGGKPIVELSSGEGPSVTLLEDVLTLTSAGGASWIKLDNTGTTVAGPFKASSGADLGGPTSVPLAKFAQVADALASVSTVLAAISGAATGPMAGIQTAMTTPMLDLGVSLGALVATGPTTFVKGA